ncbi:MAG: peptide transporter [Myxococcaceae bacterium]|nr:peptide transporter [Myxococcaceae bacterium]
MTTLVRCLSWTLTLALTITACGRKAGDSADKSPQLQVDHAPLVPQVGGDLVFAFDGAAVSQFVLDPHKSAFAPHHRILRSLFDSLVVLLPEQQFGPWLARSWQVSSDGLRYTFVLREDVTFHDGTRFDAAAVKANLDRIADPANALLSAADLGPYAGADVLDAFTVVVRLKQPYAPLLAQLSKSTLGMQSPAALQKYGADVGQHPVGSGPFKLSSITHGTEVVLERNEHYRWPPAETKYRGAPRLARIAFKNVPEEATRMAVLLNGQAGAVDVVPPQNLLALRRSSEYRVLSAELLNANYSLYLNVARAPFQDPRMREAFRQTLDLTAAVKTIYLGTTARAWSPLSPSLLGYDRSLEGQPVPDKQAAARQLDALGFRKGPDGVRVKDGKRLSLVFLDTQGNREKRLDLLTVLRSQLRENGIEVRIDSQPLGAYQQKAQNGEFDLAAGSLFAADPDVLRRLYSPLLRAKTAASKVDDPELTAVLERAARELDRAARAALYAQAQRLILQRNYAIPTYVLQYTVATSSKVQDLSIDQHGFPTFYEAWIRHES